PAYLFVFCLQNTLICQVTRLSSSVTGSVPHHAFGLGLGWLAVVAVATPRHFGKAKVAWRSHRHSVSGGVIRSFLRALRLSVFCMFFLYMKKFFLFFVDYIQFFLYTFFL